MASTNYSPTPTPTPTTTAIAIGTALIAGIAGYFLGQGSSLGLFGSTSTSARTPRSRKSKSSSRSTVKSTKAAIDGAAVDFTIDTKPSGRAASVEYLSSSSSDESDDPNAAEESSEDEDEDDGHSAWEIQDSPDDDTECKLVLVVRTDLGMSKGKIAAQASHATLACYRSLLTLSQQSPASPSAKAAKRIIDRWFRYGQAKVAVQAKSEAEIELLQAQAMSLGVCAQVVRDAGRTQIAAGSVTVLGVGPAGKSRVDGVTGSLKLL